jgi:hypothetical protein
LILLISFINFISLITFKLLVKILKDKGVAFVTYTNSLNAEFAKEAMSNQSLDNNEVSKSNDHKN